MPRVLEDPQEQRPRRECANYRKRSGKCLTPTRGPYIKQLEQYKKPERRKRKVRITALHQKRINRERRQEKERDAQRHESPAVVRPPQPNQAAPVIRKGHVEVVIYVKSVKKK